MSSAREIGDEELTAIADAALSASSPQSAPQVGDDLPAALKREGELLRRHWADSDGTTLHLHCADLMDQAAGALTNTAPLVALLQTVMDYHEGKKPFDFHRLPDDQRANEAFDAWQEIAARIRQALSQYNGEGDRHG